MAKADEEIKKMEIGKAENPKSIRVKLSKIMKEQRENEENIGNQSHVKFLNAMMKPYSELDPNDRLELYESESLVKRTIILNYQWKKMDTLWFQENKRSHPYMKKPYRDLEIEADLKILMEKLNNSHQPNAARNISNGSANLFRLPNQG